MLPTLKPSQEVLALCWFFKLKIGDIVIIKHDGKDMVKRVQKIRGREYYVIGDNQKESTDSRHFGWIDRSEVVGKIILIADS